MFKRSLTLFSLSTLILGGSAFATPLSDMISPITHPVTFEDPRASTELRAIFVNHEIDDNFVTEGGSARILALQARYAVDDRLAIIATKDGYVQFQPDAVLNDGNGFANIAVGAKYAFFKDDAAGQIITAGLRYEIPLGEHEVLQGQGDGNLNPFISAATTFDNIHLMVGSGFRVPFDSKDSTMFDFDAHLDVMMGSFYPTLELGVINVVDAGERLPIADEGEDFFNLGSSASDGKTLVTGAVGGRYRMSDDMDLGLAYQFPLSSGAGINISKWRLTADLIWRFSI